MPKSKKMQVYSIYCGEEGIEDYPYFPFVARNVTHAIRQYVTFFVSKDRIPPFCELHLIGTCDVSSSGISNIQPIFFPKRVDFEGRLFGRLVALSTIYLGRIISYIERLKNHD